MFEKYVKVKSTNNYAFGRYYDQIGFLRTGTIILVIYSITATFDTVAAFAIAGETVCWVPLDCFDVLVTKC